MPLDMEGIAREVSRRAPYNILRTRGIVPTTGGFSDGAPDNLANCTDGDPTTACGFGTKILGGSGEVGYFDFAIGKLCAGLLVGGKCSGTASASNFDVSIYGLKAGTATSASYQVTKFSAVGDTVRQLPTAFLCDIDTVRVYVYGNGAATNTFRIFSIYGYEMVQ